MRLDARKSPAVTKSVVRWMALAPTMVILFDTVAATARVIDPVPATPMLTV